MSLQGAAAAMGVPEPLVQRAAEARAAASGASTDEILAAWAGGESAPATTPPPVAEPEPETAPEPAPEPTMAPAGTAEPAPATEPATAVPTVRSGPSAPPVLVGRAERMVPVLVGAAGLLAVSLFVGLIAPSVPADSRGVYTSHIEYSETAREGRAVYRSAGCAACHTQLVRPLVTDANLGGVSLSDTNQILGSRRYGPDLAHIGSRVETDADLVGVLDGGGRHASYSGLAQSDIDALIAYLMESA